MTVDLSYLGMKDVGEIGYNLPVQVLVEKALTRGEGKLGMNGALMVDTGRYTGRSPNDKFFVQKEPGQSGIWWGPVNRPISEDVFDLLLEKVVTFYNGNEDGLGTSYSTGFAARMRNRLSPSGSLPRRPGRPCLCTTCLSGRRPMS